MFKFAERDSVGCQKIIETVETEIGWMKKLWEHIKKCQDQFDQFLKLTWVSLDLNQM